MCDSLRVLTEVGPQIVDALPAQFVEVALEATVIFFPQRNRRRIEEVVQATFELLTGGDILYCHQHPFPVLLTAWQDAPVEENVQRLTLQTCSLHLRPTSSTGPPRAQAIHRGNGVACRRGRSA